jgi:hypothetical protein
MHRLIALLILSFISANLSAEDIRQYTDPISGEVTRFKRHEVEGAVVYTAHEGKWLILEQNGKAVLHVVNGGSGREITVLSDKTVFGTAELHDTNNDQEYDVIVYRNEGKEIKDIGLDGDIDSVIDYDQKSMLINYKGQLTQLLGEGKKRHIFINGKKIEVVYKDGKYVPVQ